jgi:CO/xanthine dehydrogenase Mo-binding subunit
MNVQIEHPSTQETYILKASSTSSTQRELPWNALEEGLNVETAGPRTLLACQPKCSIQFGIDSTVTIVLGMRDFGWADASTYFANFLVRRLGIPFNRIRLYYTGIHPATRRTPKQSSQILGRANVGAANAAIGDLIEELCNRAIERGRHFLASSIGVFPCAIKFDPSLGRFFVAGSYHPVDFLEVARQARRGREPGLVDGEPFS